jgi:hypothetical protein
MTALIISYSHTQFPNSILQDNYITVQDASEVSGYNPQYLRRLLRTSKLSSVKIGQV